MNIGFHMCIVLVPCFAIVALIFGIMKEKAAKLISGFNWLPKEEQELYDKAAMVKDMRNDFIIWGIIMLVGAICSYFISGYAAIVAYLVWLIMLFEDVGLDARKTFEKYKVK